MAKESRAKAAMGGKKSSSKSKSKKHKVHRMHISHAANGGFVAAHETEPGMPPDEMEQHSVPPGGLADHVTTHMEDQMPPAGGPPAGPAGPPAGATPPPQPMGGGGM